MLESVVITNSQGNILVLNLNDAATGILVESVEGLDPVKATLVSSSFSTLDGATFQSSRREPRNLKFRLGLEPDYASDTVQSLRKQVYDFFMPKSKIIMQFYDTAGGLNSDDITGIVESTETPLFTSDPAVDISVMCYDPDFVSHDAVVVSSGTVADASYLTVNYLGTTESGFKFALAINRSLSAFTIKHLSPDGTIRTMDFSYAFLSGDVLTVNTVPGGKYVELLRGGVKSSLLYAMARVSQWIDLQPGANYFNVYAVGASIPFTITYNNRYGGL